MQEARYYRQKSPSIFVISDYLSIKFLICSMICIQLFLWYQNFQNFRINIFLPYHHGSILQRHCSQSRCPAIKWRTQNHIGILPIKWQGIQVPFIDYIYIIIVCQTTDSQYLRKHHIRSQCVYTVLFYYIILC